MPHLFLTMLLSLKIYFNDISFLQIETLLKIAWLVCKTMILTTMKCYTYNLRGSFHISRTNLNNEV